MSEDSAWTVSAGTLTALPFRKCATLQEEGLRSLPRYASNVREWLPLSLLFGTALAQSQAELDRRSHHVCYRVLGRALGPASSHSHHNGDGAERPHATRRESSKRRYFNRRLDTTAATHRTGTHSSLQKE